jgi:hypothetical protein
MTIALFPPSELKGQHFAGDMLSGTLFHCMLRNNYAMDRDGVCGNKIPEGSSLV